MRRNLREKSNNSKIIYTDEMQRIETIFTNTQLVEYYKDHDYVGLYPQYTSIKSLFDSGLFVEYPFAENYINVDDMRYSLGISKEDIKNNKCEIMLDYFEFMYNLISFLISKLSKHKLNVTIVNSKYVIKILDNINNTLDRLNYELVCDEDGYHYITEKDSSATAVAELYPDLSDKILEYRRYILKGNIERKCEILNGLANKFEAIRPALKKNNFSEIESKAGSLLNNLNIRHNAKEGKYSNNCVINMSNEELETWYDRTYDLLLICFMFYHYLDYRDDIKNLNQNFQNKV